MVKNYDIVSVYNFVIIINICQVELQKMSVILHSQCAHSEYCIHLFDICIDNILNNSVKVCSDVIQCNYEYCYQFLYETHLRLKSKTSKSLILS